MSALFDKQLHRGIDFAKACTQAFKITRGGVVTTLAGSADQPGSADGLGAAARFSSPTGVVVDAVGNL